MDGSFWVYMSAEVDPDIASMFLFAELHKYPAWYAFKNIKGNTQRKRSCKVYSKKDSAENVLFYYFHVGFVDSVKLPELKSSLQTVKPKLQKRVKSEVKSEVKGVKGVKGVDLSFAV
jgi:hypothetical protein